MATVTIATTNSGTGIIAVTFSDCRNRTAIDGDAITFSPISATNTSTTCSTISCNRAAIDGDV